MTKVKSNLLFTIILFSFLFWIPKLSGQPIQQDTSYTISPIQVTASKIRQQAMASVNREWKATQLEKIPAKNLAELLSTEAGIYIKSYGQGSLATSSIRGGSAGHTLILWNGLPIQNPMLGQLDLALLPIQVAESINLTLGSNASMWGSGAIGGVLNMKNQADFSKKLHVESSTQLGNFGHFQQQVKLGLGNEKLQSTTKFSHQQANNDFYYFLADGLPERQQSNAQLAQQFVGQDLYWKINSQSNLALHFWWQQSDRQIPPTNVQNYSKAHQDDLATRLVLEYKHLKNNGLWNTKVGFFDEHLNYFDDIQLLESRSHFRTYLGEITGQWTLQKNNEFLIGNTHTYTRAWSAGYQENIPTEYKSALFASWKYHGKKLNTQFSLRQEMVNATFVPFIPSFGFDWHIAPTFFLKGKFSRNYRLPTFNDRFWLPGGNPDLLPESGWSQEMTLAYEFKKNKLLLNASLTTYNRIIDNWILWSKQEGQSFWSANNITKVWSRGIEPRMSITHQLKNIKWQLRGGYDYIRSTNQVTLENPKMTEGDQLIYTPVHQAFSTLSVEWNRLHIAYQHTFIGSTNGINHLLDAYQVGNVRIQYSGVFKQYKGILFFNINNIWDANYLVVERRPMPGIHFQGGLSLGKRKKIIYPK